MDSWTVVMIEATDILGGTSGRGELEGRIKEMLVFFRKNPTVIPFFEEVHRLLDTDDQSSRTVATALKPPMALSRDKRPTWLTLKLRSISFALPALLMLSLLQS
jgi:ATP-dependent Clp protease ATP-binding subunit ClpA